MRYSHVHTWRAFLFSRLMRLRIDLTAGVEKRFTRTQRDHNFLYETQHLTTSHLKHKGVFVFPLLGHQNFLNVLLIMMRRIGFRKNKDRHENKSVLSTLKIRSWKENLYELIDVGSFIRDLWQIWPLPSIFRARRPRAMIKQIKHHSTSVNVNAHKKYQNSEALTTKVTQIRQLQHEPL